MASTITPIKDILDKYVVKLKEISATSDEEFRNKYEAERAAFIEEMLKFRDENPLLLPVNWSKTLSEKDAEKIVGQIKNNAGIQYSIPLLHDGQLKDKIQGDSIITPDYLSMEQSKNFRMSKMEFTEFLLELINTFPIC